MSVPGPGARVEISPWSIAGAVGMAGVAFLIGATAVVVSAPWWAVTALVIAWLAGAWLTVAWFVRRPGAVAALPVALATAWFLAVVSGARWLGWS